MNEAQPKNDLALIHEQLKEQASLLTTIVFLLQQFVEHGVTKLDPRWSSVRYMCIDCHMGWQTYEDAAQHWTSGQHSLHGGR